MGNRNQSQSSLESLVYLLPRDSGSVVASNIHKCRNLGLILARYIPQQVIENRDVAGERNAKWRDKWMKDQCKLFGVEDRALNDQISANLARWQATTEGANRFALDSLSRLIVGLGGESVLETALTLQFITGLPYIPGSALKGLCRHYALLTLTALGASELKQTPSPTPLQELDEALVSLEWDAEFQQSLAEKQIIQEADDFRAIFGSTDYGGICIFFDAIIAELPESGFLFEPDVMTPHFGEYYTSNGSKPPADNDSPNPIHFLTVAAGTRFAFAIGLRHPYQRETRLADQAAQWLKQALHEMGIGAKTAAGYGVFEKA